MNGVVGVDDTWLSVHLFMLLNYQYILACPCEQDVLDFREALQECAAVLLHLPE